MSMESTSSTGGATWYGQARAMKDAGISQAQIVERLVDAGMDPERARELARSVYGSAKIEIPSVTLQAVGRGSTSLARSVGAGVGTSLVCAVLWGMVARATGYSFGYAAWGLGVAVGAAVYVATPEEHQAHAHLPLIACLCAILGIVVGQYFSIMFILARDHPDKITTMDAFTLNGFQFYLNNLNILFSPMSLVFTVLAVISAYKLAAQGQ